MKLGRLNSRGLDLFSQFLAEVKQDSTREIPTGYLWSPETTQLTDHDFEPEAVTLDNRFTAGQWFHAYFERVAITDVDSDRGLWSWLALALFDRLCPKHPRHGRKVRDSSRLLFDPDFKRYYRHLLAGPFFIYRQYSDNPASAMAILCQAVDSPGDIVEQIASRQELVANRDIVSLLTSLYYDSESGRLKRGAGGKGGGSARRLANDLIAQFDLTWDLQTAGVEKLEALLPDEFNRFRRQ